MADSSTAGSPSASLRHSLKLITWSGCLCMIFITGIESPATTEFFRSLGATDLHFGLLSGVPMAMVFLQFAGAVAANRLRRRKRIFMIVLGLARLLYIPLAFLPLLLPSLSVGATLAVIIGIIALISAMGNFITPLWFTWMADLIPHKILNTYWGVRQRWMYVFWTSSYVVVMVYMYLVKASILFTFPLILTVAVLAGLIDLSLFRWVEEPKNVRIKDQNILEVLKAPLTHKDYGSFVLYTCLQSLTIMFAAAFMQPYALKILGLPVWQTTLLWCISGVGNALTSRWWGELADRYGHKPILTICINMKPVVVLGLLLATGSHEMGFLLIIFFLDGIWNAGLMVASNGYMMKIAPQENRSMYVAVLSGFGGFMGGVGAMMGGVFLRHFSGFRLGLLGRTWNNYHLLFFLNIFMRLLNGRLIRKVREPECSHTSEVLNSAFRRFFFRFPESPDRD